MLVYITLSHQSTLSLVHPIIETAKPGGEEDEDEEAVDVKKDTPSDNKDIVNLLQSAEQITHICRIRSDSFARVTIIIVFIVVVVVVRAAIMLLLL